jgi:hypothetical protein
MEISRKEIKKISLPIENIIFPALRFALPKIEQISMSLEYLMFGLLYQELSNKVANFK